MEQLSSLTEPLRALGFKPTDDLERPFVRKGKAGSPTVVVKVQNKPDAKGVIRPYVFVDGEPFRRYGGYVEVPESFDVARICDIVRKRLKFLGITV